MSDTNPRPHFKDIQTSGSELANAPWREAIAKTDWKEIEGYSTPLFAAARAAAERGEEADEKALVVLAAASSMYYDREDLVQPFKPAVVTKSGRSAALEDFNDTHLDALREALESIDDLELQARLADILWVRRKDHASAKVAFRSYLALAQSKMDSTDWVVGFDRLRRALEIAGGLGKKNAEWTEAVGYATQLLGENKGTDPLYLTNSVVELMLRYKALSPGELAVYAVEGATAAEAAKDWMRAAEYRALAARCYAKGLDNESETAQKRLQGEDYLKVAGTMADDSGLASEHWLERAYHVLRESGESQERLVWVEQRLREAQQRRLGTMAALQHEIPISPELQAYLERARIVARERGRVLGAPGASAE